jgi:hypothetical protein
VWIAERDAWTRKQASGNRLPRMYSLATKGSFLIGIEEGLTADKRKIAAYEGLD